MLKCKKILIKHKEEVLVDFSFSLKKSLALVGQSGSGKSLTLKALLGLLPETLQSVLEIESDFKLKRGESIGFVPQNSFTALSPMTRIKDQWLGNFDDAKRLFDMVGLDNLLLDRFPSELSGGQLQRVVIAIALSKNPKLLLLDEPTTALDPKLRDEIVKILVQLQNEIGFLMLFVTHDIKIAGELCEEILVLKEGQSVEFGKAKEILFSPKEGYTQQLIEASFANREFRE